VIVSYRFFLSVLFAAVFLTPAHSAAQDTAGLGTVTGVVFDSDGQPALAVTVCVIGTTRCTITGADGRFRLGEIRPGLQTLEITPPGLPRFEGAQVEVRAGLDAVVEILLPKLAGVDEFVTVRAASFVAPEEVKNSAFVIDPAEIASGAGSLQDISRYLQTLPGVVLGTNDFRNDIIVRGGSPLENLFIIDNIEIPNINAFANFTSAGGTVSVLDTYLIDDVTFLTGGYPAPYINRVSSVLQVAQREGNRERLAGQATLGFAGAGGIIEGPIASGRGSWVVSARRSFLDLVTDDIGGAGGVPVLYTLNAKAVYDVSPRDRVWAATISGVDRIRLGLTEDSDLNDEISDFDIRYEGWRSATGVNWQRIFGERGVGLLGVSHSIATLDSTVKDLLGNGVPPPDLPVDEIIAGGPVVFRDESSERETTLKYDLTTYLPMFGKLQAGGSFKIFQLDYDTASPLGNDSPYSPEPNLDPFAITSRFTAYQTGAYAQATSAVTSRLNLTVGGRFDHYQYIAAARVSPRAGVSFALSDQVSLRASYGRYYQQPFFPFLAVFVENRQLLPIRADHFVAGVSWQLDPLTRAGVEVYRKNYADYPVSITLPELSLANVGDTFNVRDVLFPMSSDGTGRAEGIELVIERKPGGRWYGQANLAWSRARHAGLDGVLRPGSFDSPVVANVDGGVALNPQWQLSARFSFLSGRPYTPFDEALSSAQRRGIYDIGLVNGIRAPDYARLDLRVERRFVVGGQPLVIFGGVQNVTNRENVARYTWNRRRNEQSVQTQIGIFPILGLDWRF
jgi:outer membrane receptor protein involved in Fe transport